MTIDRQVLFSCTCKQYVFFELWIDWIKGEIEECFDDLDEWISILVCWWIERLSDNLMTKW